MLSMQELDELLNEPPDILGHLKPVPSYPTSPKCASCRFWTPEHSGWGLCRMPLDVNSEVVGRFNTQAEFWCKAWEVKDAK